MSVAELPEEVRRFCRPEARAEVEALAVEFEALKPTIEALMERAANACSAVRLATLSVDHWTQDTEDEFAIGSGSRRLYEAVWEINEATHEMELDNDEMQEARERQRWALRMECHGDTERCCESPSCMIVRPYDPKWARLVQLVDRGHLDDILRRYPSD